MPKDFCRPRVFKRRLLTKLLLVMTTSEASSHRTNGKKLLLAMNLTAIFILALSLVATAAGHGQNISLKLENAPLEKLFTEVQKQSTYSFVYFKNDLRKAKTIDLKVESGTLTEILEAAFKDQPLTYTIVESLIIIKKKPAADLNPRLISPSLTAPPITGVVRDSTGTPLNGATVYNKRTKKSVQTNSKGEFEIDGIEGDILLLSFIGYNSQDLVVRPGLLSAVLKVASSPLDEIQIIAYGSTSRRLSVGNVSTVKSSDIAKAPVSNPLLAISGRVPGVFIQQSMGVPGSGIKIIIQGQNSLNSGNDPFYVIDGVPYTSQMLPGISGQLGTSGTGTNANGNGTDGNPLSYINTQDIESIDILKDADATAIYGSRAANGAIIITTKKGTAGKASANFNIQHGWGKIATKMKLMNTQQYLMMRKEAFSNENIVPGYFDFDINGSWDTTRNTDWQKELIGYTSEYLNAIGSISGGTANTNYLLSFGYQQEGTVTPSDLQDKKASVHLNINSTSENKRFRFNFSGGYLADNNKLAQVTEAAANAFTLPPNAPKLYSDDGTLNWELTPDGTFYTFYNPLVGLQNPYINKTSNLISNAVIGYKILPGLEIKSSFGYNKLQTEEIQAFPIAVYPAFIKPYLRRNSFFNTGTISSWIIEPQMIYGRDIWKGRLEALAGVTVQQEDRDRQRLNASGFSSDHSMFNIKAASSVTVHNSANAVILSQYKYNALFGRLNYNILDKYILSFNTRRDGSSRFGKENRFHNFGSIGGAWLISNERFLKEQHSILSFAKIKASYGTTGSDQIGDYTYLNLFNNVQTFGVNYQGIISLEPGDNFPNPYLQWEQTKKLSVSLDLGILKDRILINTTFFRNRSSNQLAGYGLLSVTGGLGIQTNLPVTLQNTGLEASLNTLNIHSRSFEWSSSFNITVPKNKVVKAEGTGYDERIGQAYGVIKVYHFTGVDPNTGLYTVAGKDGKATSTPDPNTDKTVTIDMNPKFYGGFQNAFKYKSLSFDLLFQFLKQIASNEIFVNGGAPGSAPVNQRTNVLDRWQKSGDIKPIQKFSLTDFPTYELALLTDKRYSDASYIRLKNVSVSFQMPKGVLRKIHIDNARLYLQGQNLLTWTNYLGGDPENRTFTGIPPLKVIALGIQVGL